MVERLFLAVPLGCLRLVIAVFPDHTHLLFMNYPILIESMCSGKSIRMKRVTGYIHFLSQQELRYNQAPRL